MNFSSEVERYCRQENTTGALLVTGEWGSGKTYFFKEILPSESWFKDHASIISISLFGITNREILDKKLKEKYLHKTLDIPEIPSETQNVFSKLKSSLTKMITDLDIKISTSEEKIPLNSMLGVVQTFSNIWDNFISIPSVDGIKKVILIFDDLERCPMDMEKLLGAINAYVEGSEIKTILIANEDYIKKKETTDKTYTIMKEKLVCRTIKYEPNFTSIVENIINTYKTNDQKYTSFLKDNKKIFIEYLEKLKNIRILKTAIQDFELFYQIILEEKIQKTYYKEILEKYLSCAKDHLVPLSSNKNNTNDAMCVWLKTGKLDEQLFRHQLKLYKENTPARILLREENILNLDDDTFINGISELKRLITDKQLELSDYSYIFRFLFNAQKYELPVRLDMDTMKSSIEAEIQKIKSGDVTTFSHLRYSFTTEERSLLTKTYSGINPIIELLEKIGNSLPELNRRAQLIKALKEQDENGIKNSIHQYCGAFDNDFADAIYQYWSTLKKLRYNFMQDFMLSFTNIYNFEDTYNETIKGIKHLISLLTQETSEPGTVTSAVTKIFIQELKKKCNTLQEKFANSSNSLENSNK